MNAQRVDIFLQKDKNTLEVSIVSDSNIQLNMGLHSTHVYGVMDRIEEYPIYDNNLYLFVYENKEMIPKNEILIMGQPDAPPLSYKKEMESYSKKLYERYIIRPNERKKIIFDFLVHKNDEEVLKKYSCNIYNCFYDYYLLKRGKKYKLQIQLKIKSNVYKSNIVEFVY
ncbi:hypothetical protein [Bergeyella zoohelcum]|nr:hypothetical protein [Bergeyella zoohelcum]